MALIMTASPKRQVGVVLTCSSPEKGKKGYNVEDMEDGSQIPYDSIESLNSIPPWFEPSPNSAKLCPDELNVRPQRRDRIHGTNGWMGQESGE